MLPILYSDKFLCHDTGYGHPEKARRLEFIVKALKDAPWSSQLEWLVPQSCEERNPIPWIEKVHHPNHIKSVENLAVRGGGQLDPDTIVSPQTYDVALLAVNAWLDGVDQVLHRHSPAFVAARPPGHHAMPNYGMGFCIFNNVAIAAHYALSLPTINRVAILDWDVHHGNGTQAIAENQKDMYYCSLHQAPFYPGTGCETETGQFGNILNVPIAAGSTIEQYEVQMQDKVLPFLKDAKPDVLLVSAGYDALKVDPLAEVALQPEDYRILTHQCFEVTSSILFGLEGGYQCEALAQSVQETLAVCLNLIQLPLTS